MSLQVIPITNEPRQSLTVAVSVDSGTITLNLCVYFSEMSQYWVLQVADANGNVMVDSIPLITGYYPANNLLGQWQHLGIGSAYMVNVSGTAEDYPSVDTLGTDWQLWWGDSSRA